MLKTGLQTSKGPMQSHTQSSHWAKKDRCQDQHKTPVWSKSSPQSPWPAAQSGWGLAGPPSLVQRGHPPGLWGCHHAPCTHCQHIATHPLIHDLSIHSLMAYAFRPDITLMVDWVFKTDFPPSLHPFINLAHCWCRARLVSFLVCWRFSISLKILMNCLLLCLFTDF